MRYFVIFLILIGLAGMMLLFDNALAEDPPLILTKVELWGPSSFIANNVKSCIDNTVGQLGPWAVGWIEIQNTKDKTITAQDITLRVGSIHSIIPITLEANESCIFQTEDQITTRIGPGGSEGNGPPHGYDGSTVVFDYIVEENGKKIHYVDTTPEISDTFGDTRIWQLVDDDWLFKEGSIDNILQRTNGGSVSPDRTVYPVPWEDRPPLKQFKDGIDPKVIHCNDKLVLIQKYDGTPACVKDSSIVSLITRGWAELSDFTITKGFFAHTITNGKIISMEYHGPQDCAYVVVKLQSQDDGNLTILIPRKIIDIKFGDKDDNFMVLVGGQEVDYEEIHKDVNQRTLSIPFKEGSETIEIIKACPI